jgi:hypothetical protein
LFGCLSFRSSVSRCFQVARHTSRILPASGDAADDIDAASAPVSASAVQALSSDVTTGDLDVSAAAITVASLVPPKTPAAGVPGIFPKYAPSSIPPNVLAELQVCCVQCQLAFTFSFVLRCWLLSCINLINDRAFQDIMGLRLGAAVATIKRNAQGVVTGYRESKTAKAGCSLVRRYEVQVRLSLDNSSVFLYPDQLNVLSSHPHLKQTQPSQVAALQRLPPHFEKEARTLDSSVVDAAVCSPLLH